MAMRTRTLGLGLFAGDDRLLAKASPALISLIESVIKQVRGQVGEEGRGRVFVRVALHTPTHPRPLPCRWTAPIAAAKASLRR